MLDAKYKLYFTVMTLEIDSHQNAVPLLSTLMPSHLNGNVSQSPWFFSYIAFHLFFSSRSFYFHCDFILLYISATFSRYKMCNFLNNYLVSY